MGFEAGTRAEPTRWVEEEMLCPERAGCAGRYVASHGGQQERRRAVNGQAYSRDEFMRYYGNQWLPMWSEAPAASGGAAAAAASAQHVRRCAEDGQLYSFAEFVQYYGEAGEERWMKARPSQQVVGGERCVHM